MNQSTLLILAAFAMSVLLFIQLKRRLVPGIALAATAIEVLFAFHILTFSIAGLPMGLILGAAIAIAGVLLWIKIASKWHVTAATWSAKAPPSTARSATTSKPPCPASPPSRTSRDGVFTLIEPGRVSAPRARVAASRGNHVG